MFSTEDDGIGYVRTTKNLRDKKNSGPQAYFINNNNDYYKNEYWRKPFDWCATSIRIDFLRKLRKLN